MRVEIRDPSGAAMGSFTMTLGTGTTYRYAFTPTMLGAYSFTVTAVDPSGNPAMASGAFVVRDTTPPIANAGPDQTVLQGSTVKFDGTESTDQDGIANYTWMFVDNGAKTIFGARPTHRFDSGGTFTVTLTIRDPSGNPASDDMWITVTSTSARGAIQGTVRDAPGRPIGGATVRLLASSTEIASAATNGTGGYAFRDVAPGTYSVQVEMGGFEAAAATVTVASGETATRDFTLLRPNPPSGVPEWALPVGIAAVMAALVFVGIGLIRRSRNIRDLARVC
ncbi:MAG: PKD domain-containing protein [Methanobacteriota archaeon]|nr:MAG: PKD domain-containing protein [Euryarchaeota archaeon]